jgi:tripartite-type tricarboxylate transporter receptor subunit TctC
VNSPIRRARPRYWESDHDHAAPLRGDRGRVDFCTRARRPCRSFVVPFPADVAPDVGCRVLTARRSEMWGQQAVVENKPGAGGNVGTETVARSAPDGYTVLMAAFTHAVNVSLYRSIGYDPVADFQPVTLLSYQPCVMIVPNSSPVQTVADFISYAKANRGKISYASAGHGTSPHLCGELFKRMTGIEMTHVPYRTGAQQDLVAGHIDVMLAVAPFELLRAGHARGLAVTTARRVPAAPEMPTLAESGLASFDVAPWWGLFLPAKTAPAIVARLHSDTIAALAEPEIQKRMQDLGSIPVGSTPEELARYLQAEMAKWGPIIRDANIRLDG